MPTPRLSEASLHKLKKTIDKHRGDRNKVAAELKIPHGTLQSRIRIARARMGKDFIPTYPEESAKSGGRCTPEQIAESVEALRLHNGNKAAAARSLGITPPTLGNRLRGAELRTDWRPRGQVRATKARPLPLPKKGKVARYILTCAQSGTKLHEPTWEALLEMANTLQAELHVSTFSYVHREEGSAKRGTGKDVRENAWNADWYDPRIEPYVLDEMVALAPNLIWNGHMNILPTAVDPLSGMDNYNGRASSVFPHAKVAMKSIATTADSAAKLQYTTGACTQINYIQKKAGQKAEFDHVYGGLLVEVNEHGAWWARQLHVDSRGEIMDGSEDGGAKAVVFGDAHVALLSNTRRLEMLMLVRGVKPQYIVVHDVLDMESRGHHNRRDPHKMFELHVRERESVRAEVSAVGEFLRELAAYGKVVVVNSNHDRHLERWLREADWRSDPVNAEFYTDAQAAYLAAIRAGKPFNALKWGVQKYSTTKGVRFLEPGESFIVCRDASGGIELGLHGDLGPGGSRGSIRNLSRLGRKVVLGHTHAAGIFNGAYQVGVSADIAAFDYARGAPNAWSHTDCIVHANGKRQLVTWWKGRWRA